jgi:hypothetical protein
MKMIRTLAIAAILTLVAQTGHAGYSYGIGGRGGGVGSYRSDSYGTAKVCCDYPYYWRRRGFGRRR